MKKEIILLGVCMIVGIIAYQYRNGLSVSDNEKSTIVLSNIEALMSSETSESGSNNGGELSGDGEGGNYTREECLSKDGNWNMASVCVDGGTIQKQCEVSGEITIMGITVKGSYKSGKLYNLFWERYQCQSSSGNCCVKQGMFAKEI